MLVVLRLVASSASAAILARDFPVDRHTVAMDAHGDVVLGATVRVGGSWSTIEVMKVSASTGEVRWTRRITGQARRPSDEISAIALDASGDVFVAGGLYRKGRFQFMVAKLSGRTGARRWRVIVPSVAPGDYGFDGTAWRVAVENGGDPVVMGALAGASGAEGTGIVRLAGRSGTLLWKYVDADDSMWALAVDATGNVVAAGRSAVKLAGGDGSVRWVTRAAPVSARALVLDAQGDVVLGGSAASFAVAKLSGTDGAVLWSQSIVTLPLGAPGFWQSAFDVRTDANGDVIAAGFAAVPTSHPNNDDTAFTVAKFAGDTGAERWHRLLTGTGEAAFISASALAVAPDGGVLATGDLADAGTCFDWAILKLAAASGDVVWQHVLDGSEQATICQWDDSEGGGPPPPHVATDKDSGLDVLVEGPDTVAAIGALADRLPDGSVSSTLRLRRFSLTTGQRLP